MKKPMTSLAALCAVALFSLLSVSSTACSFEHSTSVLAPTEITGGGGSTTTPSPSPGSNPTTTLVGVWASNASAAVPAPSTCNGFEFQVTNQTANSVTGSFSGKCGGGIVISGSGTGQLNGDAVTLNVSGSATGAGLPNCPFTLTANGTVADEGYALPLSYTGTTCLGPVNGTTTLRRPKPQAPPPPPPPAPAPAPAPAPPPPPGSEYHVGPGAISEDRAKQIVFATAEEFPHLTAVFGSESEAVAAAEQLLLRTIWHLKLAGFDAARQKNPSGAISNDKVCIHVNGGWHVYDIYSLGYAGRATTVIFFEVPLPNPQPNGGIADGN